MGPPREEAPTCSFPLPAQRRRQAALTVPTTWQSDCRGGSLQPHPSRPQLLSSSSCHFHSTHYLLHNHLHCVRKMAATVP